VEGEINEGKEIDEQPPQQSADKAKFADPSQGARKTPGPYALKPQPEPDYGSLADKRSPSPLDKRGKT